MRNSPVSTVDPEALDDDARAQVSAIAHQAGDSGVIDLSSLPRDVVDQLQLVLESLAAGTKVSMVAEGKPLTSREAADLLGMSLTHFKRLCSEGRIPSFRTGNALRVDSDVVLTILRERGRATNEARIAATTADQRRRARAAKAAGLT